MDLTPVLVETWTLYAIGSTMIGARVFVRTRLVGVQGYGPDDYLVWFTWLVYTCVTIIAHVFLVQAGGKHTSVLTNAQRASLSMSERKDWQYGSKLFSFGFLSYATIVWSLKFNMLFFYRRLVRGLHIERFILPAFGFVTAAGIAAILTFCLACVPFTKLWQVYPNPGGQCYPQNPVTFYTVAVLNVLTDMCIIAIPIPMVLRVQASIMRKIGLMMLFGLGLFCMIAAIVRVVLIFKLQRHGDGALWSIREDFVAVIVGQAPLVYPITKPRFWKSIFGNERYEDTNDHSQQYKDSKASSKRKPKDPYMITQTELTMVDKSESTEEIMKVEEGKMDGGILVQRTYNVDVESSRSESGHEDKKYPGQAF
ncbi:hypothetical protein H112_05936 [Trichophyton rubrum D6]|uniref:Rhodopsin domain-containing protein n=4 Tax=Trichophyton TaxID=5550 RepID=A0A178ESS0_TRIRU|nr:uncharacterized protein TERG_03642 [Trichophyton rubrum CBS 118892]EZF15183.1 hypothetical protein H100_05951 [Trichophyton rubrum MR850]EZF40017.1 hypothetical protein H102_05920 [Trichophyton rubrum CBS 100081]EZF50698.1 hypothetical protein H103_05947 [Trichophyton rubrum CBS 288.86]EZF61247.1 hypothetical protein H104_05933 [Trichophyton rubrum CBS 289.86]EZF71901.1 hypothetical protein H105_05960 [Trichophyton soudanense CBS 452.61]EZF82572.1 hypothetical protein H110_05942 [Trichophy